MRNIFYKLRHKPTGKYYYSLKWVNKDGRARGKPHALVPNLRPFSHVQYSDMEYINEVIRRMLSNPQTRSFVDEFEIEAFEKVEPVKVSTSVKIANVKRRIDEKLIISKLKASK